MPSFGGVNGSSGSRGCGDIRPPPPEYHILVHIKPSDTGAVPSGVVVACNIGGMVLVVTAGNLPRGREDDRSSDGGGVGGGSGFIDGGA